MIELCPMDSIIMELDGFILAKSKVLLVSTANTEKTCYMHSFVSYTSVTVLCDSVPYF